MSRRPVSPERDGNLHIHIGSQWVVGTYHDGWHTITRSHKGATPEGRELHTTHLRELREERSGREQAITAKYEAKCAGCEVEIKLGEPVWWSPTTKAIRHRGILCDRSRPKPANVPQSITPELLEFEKKLEEKVRAIGTHIQLLGKEVVTRLDAAEKRVKQAEAKINTTRRIEVVTPKAPKPVKVGAQHQNFEHLLRLAAARINVAMVGDAGSGKTFAPTAVAKALKLPFYHAPLGPQTSKSDLLGYMSGAGKYVMSLLCEAYENGGVVLFDEMDAANPAVLTIANGMLDAVQAGFADKMRTRHEDFIAMAAMNTFGRGADMLYVGRAQLDAATLNRWYILEWNTDWALTKVLVQDDTWVDYVQALYESVSRQRIRCTIGMRTAIMGKRAMLAGDTREQAEQGVIWAPLKPDDKQKILAGMTREGASS